MMRLCRRLLTGALAIAALLLLPGAANATIHAAGNGVYTVYVDDENGEYTARTGPSHPQGPNLNVLFGDGEPDTTFNSIRSYTSDTDYDQHDNGDADLADYIVSTVPFGSTGFRTTYTLPGPSTTAHSAFASADKLTITQDVYVVGTTPNDSRVVVTVTVRNDDSDPVDVGIRYLWDYQIGKDDGPTFRALNPLGSTQTKEADLGAPTFDSYRTEDNDANTPSPLFDVIGTANGPGSLVPHPTNPDRLVYSCWPDSSDSSFDYATHTNLEIAGGPNGDCGGDPAVGDSAVLYYFGATRESARTIAPGGSTSVTGQLGLTPPGGSFSFRFPTTTPIPAPQVPAAKACVDLRKFRFKVHHGPRSRVTKVIVTVDGKKVQTVRGHNLKTITITKFPGKFHNVKIVVHLSNGSSRTSRRAYLECTKGKPKITSHHHRRHHKHRKSS
jgi:hypothetical protein